MKQIIVPKDKKAINDLDYDIANNDQLIIWELEEEEYVKLTSLRIFDIINQSCNSLIDDYEDENISFEKLEILRDELAKKENNLIDKLVSLIEEAIKRETSIHFYF